MASLKGFTRKSRAQNTYIPEACQAPPQCPENHCVVSGDFRVNEQPGLTAMHTVWMRNHNKIVEELEKIPKFSKEQMEREKLFDEARKINIAQYQHIIYKEWLPIILGDENMKKGKISLKKDGHASNYDKDAKTQLANEFAGAAFRFGHSMVPKEIPLKDSSGNLKVNVSKIYEKFISVCPTTLVMTNNFLQILFCNVIT